MSKTSNDINISSDDSDYSDEGNSNDNWFWALHKILLIFKKLNNK